MTNKHHHDAGTSSQLSVSGKSSISVRLDREPEEVQVFFEDNDFTIVPCNPQQADTLSWRVHKVLVHGFHETHLTIEWNVSDVKVICWVVRY
jgi:hypothetical protein